MDGFRLKVGGRGHTTPARAVPLRGGMPSVPWPVGNVGQGAAALGEREPCATYSTHRPIGIFGVPGLSGHGAE